MTSNWNENLERVQKTINTYEILVGKLHGDCWDIEAQTGLRYKLRIKTLH
jgi:hypothetical protein